jgi:hypothetical protein
MDLLFVRLDAGAGSLSPVFCSVDTRTPITERAVRSVGQWSSPESLVEQFIDALNRASEEEKRPEHKGMLRRAAETIRGPAYQIAISLVSGALPHP